MKPYELFVFNIFFFSLINGVRKQVPDFYRLNGFLQNCAAFPLLYWNIIFVSKIYFHLPSGVIF
jgi:hypothetical protein